MASKVTIDGLREVEKALESLPKATGKSVLRRVLKARGKPIANAANSMAPDDPATAGGLNQSYVVSTKLNKRQKSLHKKQGSKATVEMFIGTNDPAGVQQEFGNENHGPQPHFRPAWDNGKAALLNGLKGDLWSEIEKAAIRLAKKKAREAARG